MAYPWRQSLQKYEFIIKRCDALKTHVKHQVLLKMLKFVAQSVTYLIVVKLGQLYSSIVQPITSRGT